MQRAGSWNTGKPRSWILTKICSARHLRRQAVRIPEGPQRKRNFVQNLKSGRGCSEDASIQSMCMYVSRLIEQEPEYLYIVGTGSTTARLMNYMGKPNTLLGVDLLFRGQVIGSDCTEQDILAALKKVSQGKNHSHCDWRTGIYIRQGKPADLRRSHTQGGDEKHHGHCLQGQNLFSGRKPSSD